MCDLKYIDSTDLKQVESCRIAIPYREQQHCIEDELPQPEYFIRSSSYMKNATELSVQMKNLPTALLSLVKPHKILSISKEMCTIVDFAADEITGRSLNLLYGPKTDMPALTAAIKNTGLLSSAQLSTSIYSRDGSEIQISASFAPFFADDGVLAGCTFKLLPAEHAPADSASDSDETVEGLAELMAQARRGRRANHRVQYNFRTGLAIQHSMLLHHRAGTRPPPQPAPDAALDP
jgi:hypothetical protein